MKVNEEVSCLRDVRWKIFPRTFMYYKYSTAGTITCLCPLWGTGERLIDTEEWIVCWALFMCESSRVLKICILWSYPDINPCPDYNMLIVIMTMFSVGVVWRSQGKKIEICGLNIAEYVWCAWERNKKSNIEYRGVDPQHPATSKREGFIRRNDIFPRTLVWREKKLHMWACQMSSRSSFTDMF